MAEPFPLLPASLVAILADMPLEELAFTLVPVKPRHDGWMPEKQREFVLRLALSGCVAASARTVGKSSASAYALRKRADAAGFAAAWDKACDWGVDRTKVDAALERALVGEARPPAGPTPQPPRSRPPLVFWRTRPTRSRSSWR